jgi:hypothetical protein
MMVDIDVKNMESLIALGDIAGALQSVLNDIAKEIEEKEAQSEIDCRR